MYPHDLRAPTNPRRPEPVGICDRCGFKYPLAQLRFQFDWRGNTFANLRIRVCPRDYDRPFENNRPLLIPPDPEPIKDARPYFYASQNQGGSNFVPPPFPNPPAEGPFNSQFGGQFFGGQLDIEDD